jgi:hypothetical protein
VLQNFSAIHHIENLRGREIIDRALDKLISREVVTRYLHRLRVELYAGCCKPIPPCRLNSASYVAANIQKPATSHKPLQQEYPALLQGKFPRHFAKMHGISVMTGIKVTERFDRRHPVSKQCPAIVAHQHLLERQTGIGGHHVSKSFPDVLRMCELIGPALSVELGSQLDQSTSRAGGARPLIGRVQLHTDRLNQ